ncbi:hypothetical protein F4801DRAFT_569467 [Xylaria longipes]|nr:hypothetical protein F4801DRAFT_569467 [Xylaria longipes]
MLPSLLILLVIRIVRQPLRQSVGHLLAAYQCVYAFAIIFRSHVKLPITPTPFLKKNSKRIFRHPITNQPILSQRANESQFQCIEDSNPT